VEVNVMGSESWYGSDPSQPAVFNRRTALKGAAGVAAGWALGGLAAACGGGSSGGSSAQGRLTAKGPGPGHYKIDLGGYQGPELGSKPITLRWMRQDFPPAINQMFKQQIAKFTAAYPNVTVKQEIVPYGDLVTKFQVYVASGNAPDIMMGRSDFAQAYAAGQTVLPLDDYLTPAYVDDIWKPLRDAGSAGGRLYLAPWEANAPLLVYNADLFKKAKVAPPPASADPSAGWTVAQFNEACAALTHNLRSASGGRIWAIASSQAGNGGPGSNYTQVESVWVRNMGDPHAAKSSDAFKTWAGVSADGLTASGYLNTPQAAQGMTTYQQFFSAGWTPKGPVPDQLGAGEAAIVVGGSIGDYHRLTAPGAQKFRVGVSPLPRGNSLFSCISSDGLVVWSKTRNPDAAVAFAAYLCNADNRIKFCRLWGNLPAQESLTRRMSEYKRTPEMLAIANAKISSPAPRSVGWFDYFNIVNPVVKNIALGSDPRSQLDQAAKQIDTQLKKYR
jgi:multiple sugar transport system substrate-binding protein